MIYSTNTTLLRDARDTLNEETWAYLMGGAGTEATVRRNRIALESLALIPSVLRDVRQVDASTTVFGTSMRLPVLMAPVGNLEVFHPAGAGAVGRAAGAFGITQVIAGVGPMPAVPIGSGSKGYQIYLDGDDDWLIDRASQVKEAGYTTVVLTVDVPTRARRERQTLSGYQFSGSGLSREHLAGATWQTVETLRAATELPLIVKGIQKGADASKAFSIGVDGVWVSNHGGRQLEHGRSSVEALEEVVAEVGGEGVIVFDGGVMTGSDVLKAIALGADLVAIGRLQCLALAAGGETRLTSTLEVLEEEITSQMGMLGARNVQELDPTAVTSSFPSGLTDPTDPWSGLS